MAKTTVNSANADANCWLSYRTEFWDFTTNNWVQMTTALANAAPRSYFIIANSYADTTGAGGALHFSSNAFQVKLVYSNLSNFVTAYGTNNPKFRTKVYDVAGRTVYDEYEISFTYACWTDTLTMASLADQTYNFGAALTLATAWPSSAWATPYVT